jgi:hypothetical protein
LTPAPRLERVARVFSVLIGICPDRLKYHPMNGIDHKSVFAKILNWKGSVENMTGVSIYDV